MYILDDGTPRFEGVETATGEELGTEPDRAALENVPDLTLAMD